MKKFLKFCFFVVMLTLLFVLSTVYASSNLPIIVINDINEGVTKITPTPEPTSTLTPVPTTTPTPTPKPIPKTGDNYFSILLIGLLSVVSLILFKKYKNQC